MKIQNNETVENLENLQNDEQFVHVYGLNTIVFFTVVLVFSRLPRQILIVVPRFHLLFYDSYTILADVLHLTIFYYKNSYLRKYVWQKLISSSSIKPQNDPIEIELHSI